MGAQHRDRLGTRMGDAHLAIATSSPDATLQSPTDVSPDLWFADTSVAQVHTQMRGRKLPSVPSSKKLIASPLPTPPPSSSGTHAGHVPLSKPELMPEALVEHARSPWYSAATGFPSTASKAFKRRSDSRNGTRSEADLHAHGVVGHRPDSPSQDDSDAEGAPADKGDGKSAIMAAAAAQMRHVLVPRGLKLRPQSRDSHAHFGGDSTTSRGVPQTGRTLGTTRATSRKDILTQNIERALAGKRSRDVRPMSAYTDDTEESATSYHEDAGFDESTLLATADSRAALDVLVAGRLGTELGPVDSISEFGFSSNGKQLLQRLSGAYAMHSTSPVKARTNANAAFEEMRAAIAPMKTSMISLSAPGSHLNSVAAAARDKLSSINVASAADRVQEAVAMALETTRATATSSNSTAFHQLETQRRMSASSRLGSASDTRRGKRLSAHANTNANSSVIGLLESSDSLSAARFQALIPTLTSQTLLSPSLPLMSAIPPFKLPSGDNTGKPNTSGLPVIHMVPQSQTVQALRHGDFAAKESLLNEWLEKYEEDYNAMGGDKTFVSNIIAAELRLQRSRTFSAALGRPSELVTAAAFECFDTVLSSMSKAGTHIARYANVLREVEASLSQAIYAQVGIPGTAVDGRPMSRFLRSAGGLPRRGEAKESDASMGVLTAVEEVEMSGLHLGLLTDAPHQAVGRHATNLVKYYQQSCYFSLSTALAAERDMLAGALKQLTATLEAWERGRLAELRALEIRNKVARKWQIIAFRELRRRQVSSMAETIELQRQQLAALELQTQPSVEGVTSTYQKLSSDSDKAAVLMRALAWSPGVWAQVLRHLLMNIPLQVVTRLSAEVFGERQDVQILDMASLVVQLLKMSRIRTAMMDVSIVTGLPFADVITPATGIDEPEPTPREGSVGDASPVPTTGENEEAIIVAPTVSVSGQTFVINTVVSALTGIDAHGSLPVILKTLTEHEAMGLIRHMSTYLSVRFAAPTCVSKQ
jgi:hypothetical protein